VLGLVVLILTIRGVGLGTRIAVVLGFGLLLLASVVIAAEVGAGALWEFRLTRLAYGAEVRLALLGTGLRALFENPLLGTGLGNEMRAFYEIGAGARVSHNDFISIALMTGLPGLALYLAFNLAWLVAIWRLPRGWLRSGLLGLFLANLVGGMFNPAWSKKMTWLLAGLCAAAVVAYRRSDREPYEPESAPVAAP
jgi:O-antigen ligase